MDLSSNTTKILPFLYFLLQIAACAICNGGHEDISYDRRTQFCCYGKVKPRVPSLDCCDATKSFYNSSIEACCEGGLVPLRFQWTRIGAIPIPSICCGNQLIAENDRKWKCCVNHANPSESTSYDPGQKICCNGNLFDAARYQECCGDRLYNTDNFVCCDGVTKPSIYGRWMTKCCRGAPKGVINAAKEVCIYNEPYESQCKTDDGKMIPAPQCCGLRWKVDLNTQKCCGDQVVSKDTPCCHGYGLPPNKVCCPKSGAQTKSDPNENACCESGSSFVLYNSDNVTCHRGRVHNIQTCNGERYNPTKKICCGEKLTKRYGDSMCCGGKRILQRFHTCCDNKPYRGRGTCDDLVR